MIDITTRWSFSDPYEDVIAKVKAYIETDESITVEAAKMYWEKSNLPKIKKVIFNYPATIIIWNDNSKTVVKLMEGDTWDPEKGFAMAYLKKILGTQRLKKEIKTWVKPQEEQEKDCEILVNVMKNMDEYVNIADAVSDYLKKVFKQGDKMTTDSEDK